MQVVPLCDWLKFERHDIAWPRCYHRSPPLPHPWLTQTTIAGNLIIVFLFFFCSCFCLFKKEIQKTKCLKLSSRNMLKICSKRISKHTGTHRYVFTYENMYIYIYHIWSIYTFMVAVLHISSTCRQLYWFTNFMRHKKTFPWRNKTSPRCECRRYNKLTFYIQIWTCDCDCCRDCCDSSFPLLLLLLRYKRRGLDASERRGKPPCRAARTPRNFEKRTKHCPRVSFSLYCFPTQ